MTREQRTRSSFAVRTVRKLRLARVRARNFRSQIRCGEEFAIYHDAIVSRRARLHVGDRVSVGPGLTLSANLTIGDDVMVSANVGIIGNDHPFDATSSPITSFTPRPMTEVIIEGDSLIGYGATLLGPLTIGRGAIVGARALVTADVPPGAVVTGSPAKVVRYRRSES